MKKRLLAAFLMAILIMTISFSACSNNEGKDAGKLSSETGGDIIDDPVADGTAYGYGGTDPVEATVYKYMVEEKSKDYDKADVSIPIVSIISEDFTKADEVTVYGDFWIDNYNIEGDTLKCVSGGNYPGVIHMKRDGDSYTVTRMDVVADGSGFDASARKLFGDKYEDFMEVYSDSDARDELRRITVTDYVHFNDLSVTKYQDEGWDPVELYS